MTDEVRSLNRILYNPILREKFKNFEKNKKNFPYYSKEEYVKKLEKLIIQNIGNMSETTYDIELITSWFECILEEYYLSEIYLIFYNNLNKTIIQKANELDTDIEFYTDYLTTRLEHLDETKEYHECIKKYLKNGSKKNITEEEFEKYIFALNIIDDDTEENFEYVFNVLLDKKYRVNLKEYKEFFKRFSIFIAKKLGAGNVKITFKQNLDCKGKHVVERANNKIIDHIYLNEKYLKLPNILDNLQTLFHEIKHVIQKNTITELYQVNNIKAIEDKVLKKLLGNTYYEINYNTISSEADAEVSSYILLSEFLKIYAPETYKLEQEKLDTEIGSYMLLADNNTRKLSYKDEFNIHSLFATVLHSHSEILDGNMLNDKEKQVLLQVYNSDGTTKTPNEYFDKKLELLEQLKNTSILNISERKNIQQKIEFYDTILNTFEYNSGDLKRNYYSIKDYHSSNSNINEQVIEYKNKLTEKLLKYVKIEDEEQPKVESKLII